MEENKNKEKRTEDEKYQNSYKYFENRDCKYYPCHSGSDHINCMFCYCPLYPMEHCPGNYKIIEKESGPVKSCIDCSFPHEADNFDKVMKVLKAQNHG